MSSIKSGHDQGQGYSSIAFHALGVTLTDIVESFTLAPIQIYTSSQQEVQEQLIIRLFRLMHDYVQLPCQCKCHVRT